MSERNELERLQHDIERHVSIAAEQATELARLRAEVERLTDERTRATAALREAFGEELWRLGHPAYVVVHLREELAKLDRLWKSATNERDAALARAEAAEKDAARYRTWRTLWTTATAHVAAIEVIAEAATEAQLDAAVDAAIAQKEGM